MAENALQEKKFRLTRSKRVRKHRSEEEKYRTSGEADCYRILPFQDKETHTSYSIYSFFHVPLSTQHYSTFCSGEKLFT
jgi:hypothetical protein